MKETEWYAGDQKPVRVGVYERNLSQREGFECLFFSYRNGRRFSQDFITISVALLHRYGKAGNQNLPWRGVEK